MEELHGTVAIALLPGGCPHPAHHPQRGAAAHRPAVAVPVHQAAGGGAGGSAVRHARAQHRADGVRQVSQGEAGAADAAPGRAAGAAAGDGRPGADHHLPARDGGLADRDRGDHRVPPPAREGEFPLPAGRRGPHVRREHRGREHAPAPGDGPGELLHLPGEDLSGGAQRGAPAQPVLRLPLRLPGRELHQPERQQAIPPDLRPLLQRGRLHAPHHLRERQPGHRAQHDRGPHGRGLLARVQLGEAYAG